MLRGDRPPSEDHFSTPQKAHRSFPPVLSEALRSRGTGKPATNRFPMCWISAAIAPRLPYLETRWGHWYWNEPRMKLNDLPPLPDKELELLISRSLAICETAPLAEGCPSEGQNDGKEAVPHRAPPKDRSFSIGTQCRCPAAREIRLT